MVDRDPPIGVAVETKTDEGDGVFNQKTLTFNRGVWSNGNLRMYYRPTHWRFLEANR